MGKMTGRALTSGEMMAMLDFLNGGPEMGTVEERRVAKEWCEKFQPRIKSEVGRIFLVGTMSEDKEDTCKQLWE